MTSYPDLDIDHSDLLQSPKWSHTKYFLQCMHNFSPKGNVNVCWLHIAYYLEDQDDLCKSSNMNKLLYIYIAEVKKQSLGMLFFLAIVPLTVAIPL